MTHNRVDIERWKTMFRLGRLREETRRSVREHYAREPHLFNGEVHVEWLIKGREPWGGDGVGPMGIAVHEQLLDEALYGVGKWQKMPHRVPTDVFIMSVGEPERREVTKVGGLPYWTRGRRWPRTVRGTPMTFVAQFCFADSRDLPIPQPPEDVLLVFGDQDAYFFEAPGSESLWESGSPALAFAWETVGDQALISGEEIPETGWNVTPCYGSIHRAHDYPDDTHLLDHNERYESAKIVGGVKIGGVPRWLQDEEPLPGKHLCTLDSVWPVVHEPYPFLNVEQPAKGGQDYLNDLLSWGDAGSVYIFMDESGCVNWAFQTT